MEKKVMTTVKISQRSQKIWLYYMQKYGIKDKSEALDSILGVFAGDIPLPTQVPSPTPNPSPTPTPDPQPAPAPQPTPTPTKYSVEISQESGQVVARSGTKVLASCPSSSDSYDVFKKCIDALPANGSFGIGPGLYNVSAPYKFGLDPDGSNPYYVALPFVDKVNPKIYGAGAKNTIIRLLANQRSPSRHVAMVLVRSSGPMSLGNSDFEITGITLDGNRAQQNDKDPYDGEALLLFGSKRSGTKVHDLNLVNSWASGAYMGNNGSGPGDNEQVWNIFCQNCGAEGIILDTCSNSKLADSESWNCREGFCLHGNTDWKARGKDNVSAFNLRTDSQFTCRQVNDFSIDNLRMDCTNAAKSYGLVITSAYGKVTKSVLKSDKTKPNSYGGPLYVAGESIASIKDSSIEGFYGVHAVGHSYIQAVRCNIIAPGGCFATVDPDPVSSMIEAIQCTWSGKKEDIKEGSKFVES
jgi:hypothetical protein